MPECVHCGAPADDLATVVTPLVYRRAQPVPAGINAVIAPPFQTTAAPSPRRLLRAVRRGAGPRVRSAHSRVDTLRSLAARLPLAACPPPQAASPAAVHRGQSHPSAATSDHTTGDVAMSAPAV